MGGVWENVAGALSLDSKFTIGLEGFFGASKKISPSKIFKKMIFTNAGSRLNLASGQTHINEGLSFLAIGSGIYYLNFGNFSNIQVKKDAFEFNVGIDIVYQNDYSEESSLSRDWSISGRVNSGFLFHHERKRVYPIDQALKYVG